MNISIYYGLEAGTFCSIQAPSSWKVQFAFYEQVDLQLEPLFTACRRETCLLFLPSFPLFIHSFIHSFLHSFLASFLASFLPLFLRPSIFSILPFLVSFRVRSSVSFMAAQSPGHPIFIWCSWANSVARSSICQASKTPGRPIWTLAVVANAA